MKTINLITCNNIQEAALIKGRLESEGIPCFLTNENITTIAPYLNGLMGSGTQVMIFEKDMEEAISIISPATETIRKCPSCDSENIRYGLGRNSSKKLLAVLISLVGWIPFGNISNTYYCRECKSDFPG